MAVNGTAAASSHEIISGLIAIADSDAAAYSA